MGYFGIKIIKQTSWFNKRLKLPCFYSSINHICSIGCNNSQEKIPASKLFNSFILLLIKPLH